MTDTIESLRQQLAECQAREDQRITELRIVSRRAKDFCNGSTPIQNAPYFIWQSAEAALALPNDATALNELIAERTASLTAEVERVVAENKVAGTMLNSAFEKEMQLRHQNAELTAQRDAAMNKLSTLKATFIKNMLRFMPNKTKHEIADEIDAAIANGKGGS